MTQNPPKSATVWLPQHTKAWNVYLQGGIFDRLHDDLWNQRRSQLTHTQFGNRILAIWSDSSRWQPVIDCAYRDNGLTSESREVWEESFRQWTVIKHQLLDHSRRIHQEFQLLGFADELLRNRQLHIDYCITVTRCLLAHNGKYDEWINAVEQQVSQVDGALDRLGSLAVFEGVGECIPFSEDEAQQRLVALTEAGRRLKLVYSGREYFNHGDSD